MSERPWIEARNVRTLWEAHEALVALRPGPDAGISAWLNFHLRSSAVYRRVAEVDEGHHGEALYWAEREKARADGLAAHSAGSQVRRGRRGKGELASMPATLEQAHEALSAVRPATNTPVSELLAYHRHAAEVYAEMAEVDRAHHHEARFWMSRERAVATALERQIANTGDTNILVSGGQVVEDEGS